jgi:thioredoxin reductase (NADPH)
VRSYAHWVARARTLTLHTAAAPTQAAHPLPTTRVQGFLANGIAAGGQLTTTSEIENFPGFVGGINGLELTERFTAQSKSFGTVIHDKTITRVDLSRRPFRLWAEGEEDGPPTARAAALILATGASPRKLPVPGADALWQKGLSTCATCDGYFFRKKDVAVVGGGDSAAEEALYLSKLARRVRVRGEP